MDGRVTGSDGVPLVSVTVAVDGSRPFPLLANKSLNIAVCLKSKEHNKDKEEKVFAIVQVPSILPRFLELPSDDPRGSRMVRADFALSGVWYQVEASSQIEPDQALEAVEAVLEGFER